MDIFADIEICHPESLFKKKVDVNAAQYFYECVRETLKESCKLNDLSKIFDLGVTAIDPEITVGPTTLLNSDTRLEEYGQAALKGKKHQELRIYAKHLAITIGYENYPLFDSLTYQFIEPTIQIATIAMKASFESNSQ